MPRPWQCLTHGPHGTNLPAMSDDPMQLALHEADLALAAGEVPVGAVLLDGAGQILARAHNRTERDHDPTAHAELLAIRAACAARGEPRLPDATLYVTLEPCALCAAAISFARIGKLVFAAYDPKMGAVEHGPRFFAQPTCHHRPEVVAGLREREGQDRMRRFFAGLR